MFLQYDADVFEQGSYIRTYLFNFAHIATSLGLEGRALYQCRGFIIAP